MYKIFVVVYCQHVLTTVRFFALITDARRNYITVTHSYAVCHSP
jgi:hypothetical protein